MFWPERWIIAEDADASTSKQPENFVHNWNAFVPFSFGPGICVGKNLALKELRMVLCSLLQQVDFSFVEGYDPLDWEKQLKDTFTLQVGSLPAIITVR